MNKLAEQNRDDMQVRILPFPQKKENRKWG